MSEFRNVLGESENVVRNVLGESDKILNRALDNPYINTSIKILLGLYAAFAAPRLPKSLVNLFDNIVVRIIFAFCIVFMATRDPSIAILIAVAFVVTLQTANKLRLYDTSLSAKDNTLEEGVDVVKDAASSAAEFVGDGVNVVKDMASSGASLVEDIVNEGGNLARDISSKLDFDGGNSNIDHLEGAEVPKCVQQSATLETSNETHSIQSNVAQCSNPNSCLQTFEHSNCAQGLQTNVPSGYDVNEVPDNLNEDKMD
jgi:prophage DNA circulation protein